MSPVYPASLFVSAPEHAVPPPASVEPDQPRLPSPPPSSPLPLTAQPHHQPASLIPSPSILSTWSSDDEDDSAWDTASITTTTSTTSASSPFPLSPSRTSPVPQPIVRHPSDGDDEQPDGPFSRFQDLDMQHTAEPVNDDFFDLDFNFSQESLPHIPLRPFRNQVGGHSAIYKFTKRAVCKVSAEICHCRCIWVLNPFSAVGITGELVL